MRRSGLLFAERAISAESPGTNRYSFDAMFPFHFVCLRFLLCPARNGAAASPRTPCFSIRFLLAFGASAHAGNSLRAGAMGSPRGGSFFHRRRLSQTSTGGHRGHVADAQTRRPGPAERRPRLIVRSRSLQAMRPRRRQPAAPRKTAPTISAPIQRIPDRHCLTYPTVGRGRLNPVGGVSALPTSTIQVVELGNNGSGVSPRPGGQGSHCRTERRGNDTVAITERRSHYVQLAVRVTASSGSLTTSTAGPSPPPLAEHSERQQAAVRR